MKDEDFLSGHRARLRKRFEEVGLAGFAPHEVVELLLTYVIPRQDVKPLAKRLLQRFGTLRNVLDAPADALKSIDGVGDKVQIFLRFLGQIAQKYIQEKVFDESAIVLDSRWTLRNFWHLRLCNEPNEVFEIAYLDGQFRLLPDGVERLSIGDSTSVYVNPRSIIRAILNRNCSSVVLCHNHPNGEILPSEHDERQTLAWETCLQAIQVRLLDHLIVAKNHVFSLKLQREI